MNRINKIKIINLSYCRMPSSIAKKIWLEHSGHDFELLHEPSTQNLKTRPYSKQQVAKNNFTTEPIFFAITD